VSSVHSPSNVEAPHVKPLLRGWIHQVGAVVLIACSPLLIARAKTWPQVGWVLCYVVGVATMMITSALYHRITWSLKARRAWRRADHSTIFLAITGSYLAIAGLTMHGTIRLVLLLVIGAGAAIGITIRQLTIDTPKWVNTMPYLVVGWAAVAVMPQIYRGGGPLCFFLVVAGGLAYTIGAVFFGAKRPKLSPRVFGYHELFHACTVLGAALTFWALAVALR
jgi:hemolysin III